MALKTTTEPSKNSLLNSKIGIGQCELYQTFNKEKELNSEV